MHFVLIAISVNLLVANENTENDTYSAQKRFSGVHRGERPPIDYASLPPEAYVPGIIRVKFAESTSAVIEGADFTPDKSGNIHTGLEELDQLISKYSLTDARQLAGMQLNGSDKSGRNDFEQRHRDWGFHLWYEFQTIAKNDVVHLLEEMAELDCIEVAQPAFRIVHVAEDQLFSDDDATMVAPDKNSQMTSDPRFSSQWNLQNTGQSGGTTGSDIGLTNAWQIEQGSQDVIVAIIDGGVQVDHPDLAPHMWKDEQGNTGYNFADKTATIVPSNHATHVAGIISAVTNNGIGIAGIAGGAGEEDGVRLMVLQVFGADGCDGFHLAPIFAADNGAVITQNSWVYGAPGVYDQLTLDAIDYFNAYGGGDLLEGGLTIFSAGNKNTDQPYYPASYSGTIAVASTNHNDQKASTSNYGEWVDISAPGVSILSTLNNSAYGISSGTSMACPHVAATAALMVSHAPGMLTAAEVKEMLLTSADDHYALNSSFEGMLGTGRLNTYAAMQQLPNVGDEVVEEIDDPNQDEQEEPATDPQPVDVPEFFILTDGNWHDASNWFTDAEGQVPSNEVPAPNSLIHIHAGVTANDPLVAGEHGKIIVHDDGELTATGLTLSQSATAGHQLTIQPGGRVTVTGLITDENEHGSILILGNDDAIGSLIQSNDMLQATLQLERSQNSEPWDLLSVPLSNQVISDEVVGGMIFGWDEPDQNWVNLTSQAAAGTQGAQSDAPQQFIPGTGYMESPPDPKAAAGTRTFSGILSNDVVEFPISRKASEANVFSGFNLLGNPYTASIDWNTQAGWTGKENLDKAHGSDGHSMWVWNNETGNYGAYNSASQQDLGTNQVSRYIAPMQAFWVKAANDEAVLSVNNTARVHSDQQTLKNTQLAETKDVRIAVSNHTNPYSDELMVEFGHQASGGTEKLFSMLEEAPSLYLNKQDNPLSISFEEAYIAGIRLLIGFEAGISALYTITVSDLSAFTEDVYLVDNQTGHVHNLTNNNSYHFIGNPGEDANRFVIQFGEELSTNVQDANLDAPVVYYHASQLNVTNPTNTSAIVNVYNLNGAFVDTFEVAPQASEHISFNHQSGVYFVRVNANNTEMTTKVAVF